MTAESRLLGRGEAVDFHSRRNRCHWLLDGSGLAYEAGDALGVLPANCPDVVARVMEAQLLDPDATVPLPEGGEAPLREALLRHYEIRALMGKSPEAPLDPADFVEQLRKRGATSGMCIEGRGWTALVLICR